MIDCTVQGEIAILTMAHGKANALDIEFCGAIADRFDALLTGPVRAVILTGTGKIFSAGVDLVRLTADGPDYVRQFLPVLHRLYDTVFNFPKPLIAAVNGHAIAGGCVLACCADSRVGARDGGRIGVTEVLVGVPFPAMAFEVMRFAATPQYFQGTILTGATSLSTDALARGLVDEVVEPSELMNRAMASARALAAMPPATFALTKSQIRQPVTERMARDGARVDERVEQIWTSRETLKHIGGFVANTFKKG